jgi:8-oxo-dGTP pyrophosphatase MutT (NUDIX family)
MRTVDTARILLFDAENRLLLFKYQEPGREPFWGTIGGRLEAGEMPRDAACRELFEETGLSDAIAEAAAWYLEHEIIRGGEPCRLQEAFFVARTAQTELDHSRWTEEEREIIVDTRW